MIMKTVAITGGIGSGKSVVSRLLRVEGYPVYDCDSQAKRIMDNDAEIQRQLQNAFGEDVVVDGVIHRQKLASLVFGNSENLRKLNAIVHPAVIADIKKWSVAEQKDLVFVETAILRESGMETLVDELWVDASWRSYCRPGHRSASRSRKCRGCCRSHNRWRVRRYSGRPEADSYWR